MALVTTANEKREQAVNTLKDFRRVYVFVYF